MHWGAVLVPPGYTDPVIFAPGDTPYGASVSSGGEDLSDADKTIKNPRSGTNALA